MAQQQHQNEFNAMGPMTEKKKFCGYLLNHFRDSAAVTYDD